MVSVARSPVLSALGSSSTSSSDAQQIQVFLEVLPYRSWSVNDGASGNIAGEV